MTGLAIESATGHVEVLVSDGDGETLAHEIEEVGNHHTRRLTPLVTRALEKARVKPGRLSWIGADLGPGSFTGVRVGLATARALALASGARLLGASSLAALAIAAPVSRALVVPLVPAGRRDLYAGFFRTGRQGSVHLLAAPQLGTLRDIVDAVGEALRTVPGSTVRFVGPGVARDRDTLESVHPRSTEPAFRLEGLSARDLTRAVLSRMGPAAGLPAREGDLDPQYLRPAQAEERVRHRANAAASLVIRPMRPEDVPEVEPIERQIFSDPWPASFFLSELRHPLVFARVAERDRAIAGYSLAWLGAGTGHLGNLAVVPGLRRAGVARALLADLMEHARARGAASITLEVRVSNFAAQGLYRAHGFRLAGLRRGYYGDTGEDALIMEWRAG